MPAIATNHVHSAQSAVPSPAPKPTMPLKIYISGKLYDKADAKISVYDHGLLYGDADQIGRAHV